MEFWIVLLFVFIFSIPVYFIIEYTKKKKIYKKIEESYGAIPEKEIEFDSVNAYYSYFLDSNEDTSDLIDSITWNDLNMDEVFKRVNSCQTSIGEEYLYKALHEKSDDETLRRRSDLTQWAKEFDDERFTVQKILSKVGIRDYNNLSFYLFNAEAKRLNNAWVYTIMGVLPIVFALLALFNYSLFLPLMAVSMLVNIPIYQFKKMNMEVEFKSMQYFSALLKSSVKISKLDLPNFSNFTSKLDTACDPFRHMRRIIVGREKSAGNDVDFLLDIPKMLLLFDLIRYNYVISAMVRHKAELRLLYEAFAEIDIAISTASISESFSPCCNPVFTDENVISFEGIYHPLIENAVLNDAVFNRSLIITGSNASGKSTFIKAIAINHILAQSLFICCASQYKMKPSFVISSMALRDDVISGESYFIAEIKSLKRIIQSAEQRYSVCFIDEILRGTNTVERIASSSAVLEKLSELNCFCFVASHDIELTRILSKLYDNYHFRETIEKDSIKFDYKLKNGPSNTRNAIKLLEYMGFDKHIIDQANRYVKEEIKDYYDSINSLT